MKVEEGIYTKRWWGNVESWIYEGAQKGDGSGLALVKN